ncbi:MAG: sodium/glutamate symporter [Tissierella sp.]|uniref:sodium/glutamate symporter n=1 Tax=Tissierella sp. TaxID=41274 RepID=UPI003F98679E
MILQLDMVQTISLAVILLLLGELLVKKINFLSKYCIPAPVVGGLIFAILALILRQTGLMNFEMDTTLQTLTMTMFFTSVGFSASFRLLKKGGIKLFIFLGLAVTLVVLQNVVGVGLAKLFDLDPLLGLATGSTPMTGGHGTAGAIGKLIERAGIDGANSIAIAAATFGLIAGSMIGGPTGKRLIENNNLMKDKDAKHDNSNNDTADNISSDKTESLEKSPSLLIPQRFSSATFQILIAMGIGTIVSALLEKTGLTFPAYIGAMLVGALIRNISDFTNIFETPMTEINIVGGISLSLFLSMALMTLKLWDLAELAVPFIVMLLGQVLLMFLFANFVTFNLLGRDYDAAVLSAGHCGFGLGATANGIAVMDSVTGSYAPSPTAFFILPLIGSLFIDFINIGVITTFINIFG